MTTNAITPNVANVANVANVNPACDDCGYRCHEVGRSGRCPCDPSTFTAPRFIASQVNVPTSPLFTPAMLAALLVDAETAHKAFIDQLTAEYDAINARLVAFGMPTDSPDYARMVAARDDAIASENKAWPQWYATFMAARLNQSANAARWTPEATLDVPPYAPIGTTDNGPDTSEWTSQERDSYNSRRSVLLNSPDYSNVPSDRIGTAGRNRYLIGTDNDNASE
jgi:hypothetical protein